MAKRKKYMGWSGFSLLLGLFVYVFFKEGSYLHLAAEQLLNNSFGFYTNCVFLNYYLCDFLWAFSLTCGLLFILGDTARSKILCGGIATAYGAVWEILQYTGIVPGTGDVWDVLTYFLAGIFTLFIFYKRENES